LQSPLTLTLTGASAMSIYSYYIYAYIADDGEPYYIGMGQNYRAWAHHLQKGVCIKPKNNDRIRIMERNLSLVGALALEARYIRWYGRKNYDDNGRLEQTLSYGGCGKVKPHSEETKRKVREGVHRYLKENGTAGFGRPKGVLNKAGPSQKTLDIIEMIQLDVTPKDICKKYGCTRQYISRLKKKHISVVF